MAIVAQNYQIIVFVVGSVAVNMVFRENINPFCAANCARIICFKIDKVGCFHFMFWANLFLKLLLLNYPKSPGLYCINDFQLNYTLSSNIREEKITGRKSRGALWYD